MSSDYKKMSHEELVKIAERKDIRIQELEGGLKCVSDLIEESQGIIGLHHNGDIVFWHELRTGGRYEEWLFDFDCSNM